MTDEFPSSSLIAARLTPPGRGAVAVLKLSGLSSFVTAALSECFTAANQRPWLSQPLSRPIYGKWGSTPSEDVIVCRMSESSCEIQCHGGDAAVARILDDLGRSGAETVTSTAHLLASGDTLEVELQENLTRALTLRTANVLHDQASGVLRAAFQRLVTSSWDEGVCLQLASEVEPLLEWFDFGRHLVDPWNVVLTGRPNSGKSSLINRLLGFQRSIVSDIPGTTRDVLTSTTAIDGWPVQLADTAGWRRASDHLEATGIERASEMLHRADLPIIVIDRSEPSHPDDLEIAQYLPNAIVVANKCDLPPRWDRPLPPQTISVSAITGDGIPELLKIVVKRLVALVPDDRTAVPFTSRQYEILRAARAAIDARDEWAYRRAIDELFHGPYPRSSSTIDHQSPSL